MTEIPNLYALNLGTPNNQLFVQFSYPKQPLYLGAQLLCLFEFCVYSSVKKLPSISMYRSVSS